MHAYNKLIKLKYDTHRHSLRSKLSYVSKGTKSFYLHGLHLIDACMVKIHDLKHYTHCTSGRSYISQFTMRSLVRKSGPVSP